jgi:hypothetical protein
MPAAAQLQVAELRITSRVTLDSLARLGFEVAGVREIDGEFYAVIVVSPETAGLARPVARAVPRAPAADTFRVYQSFDKPVAGIRATLEAWAAADPRIQLDSIGASVEGRPILAVKIGPAGDDPARPNVLFMGTHHAREWVSTAVAMKLIRWLVDSAPPALLGARDVWVIPVENPDGYQYTFTTERFWRKNRSLNGDGTYGVDPNRNYPAFWGLDDVGSSPTPGAETYRGMGPASELETQAIIAFHAAHPPVVAVSYHTFSGLVLYPYGYRAGELPPDLPVYQALAGTDVAPAVHDGVPGSTITHYHPGPGWHLYPTNGEYTEWAYRAHGTIAFTPELTSGCCVNGLFYGFDFPDDSVLVDRVFRDNLPFAVAVIAAAGNLRGAVGASGLAPAPPRFESLWPDAWLGLDAATPQPLSLTVRSGTGGTGLRSAQTDSLRRGTTRTVWRTDLRADTVRALRADGTGIAAELLSLAGAEPLDAGWTGWTRDTVRLVGGFAWSTPRSDTLVSPIVDLRGRTAVWLHFWTRHRGSTFAPDQRGVIQFSGDSGATWSDAAVVAGDGPNWYPVRVDLPQAGGQRGGGARVRFVSVRDFPWWLDAVGFATDATPAFLVLAALSEAEVSENPVRSDQVVISWPSPAGVGAARVAVYGFTGERLHEATVAAPTNEYVWDLTLGGARRVVNGAYIVVVEVDGRRYRRRLFVARPTP